MRWTKVGLETAKFFCKNFLKIKLCQLTKYQDQNFTSSDIDGQESKIKGKSEVQKFDNPEDKRLFFVLKNKSGYWKQWIQALIFRIKFHASKIWCIHIFYQKYTIQICLIKLEFSKFLPLNLADPFSHYVYIHLSTL